MRERTNTFVLINDLIVVEKKKTIAVVVLLQIEEKIVESETISLLVIDLLFRFLLFSSCSVLEGKSMCIYM